jgi:hypothetical protein
MTRGVVVVLACTLASAASAQVQVLQREPAVGQMRSHEVVYVQSKRCPAGQVMEVRGGNNVAARQTGRQRRCVPKP